MGFNDLDDDDGGYVLFENGDNAIAKPSKISVDKSSYQGDTNYQLRVEFEAVEELDEEDRGTVPYWINSRITVRGKEHSSNLAKLLSAADVIEPVLKELGAGDDLVEKIMDGDKNFVADSDEENVELAKAVLKNLPGNVFRVSTTQAGGGEYSRVDEVYGLKSEKEGLFDGFDVDVNVEHSSDDSEDSDGAEGSEDSSDEESSDDEEGSDKETIL